jgi:hydrophobic/amphiphilic exporter-1 (mainly G- bacteria), HAE1 family
MPITKTSIHRPVATAMVFLIVVTLGMIGFRQLPVDLLPPIEFPQLTVNVNYGNTGPEEMERLVTERIENAVAGIPNVERITSNSSEGSSRVTLNFRQGINLDEATNDLRAALDRLRNVLPQDATPPGIWKFDPNDAPVVVLGARSPRDMAELTRIIERDLAKRLGRRALRSARGAAPRPPRRRQSDRTGRGAGHPVGERQCAGRERQIRHGRPVCAHHRRI